MHWTRILVTASALFAFGCGGNGSSPSPSPSPVPTPAPQPQFPNMIGGWAGTLNIGVVQVGTGIRTTNICNETWVITTQTVGTFSGTFQLTGGTNTTCAQSGSVSGTVSTSGALSGLTSSVTLGDIAQCSRIQGDGTMSGIVTNSASVTAQSTDRIRCTVGGLTTDNDRTLSLLMNKR